MNPMKIPGAPTRCCATPSSDVVIAMLGGTLFNGVSFARDQVRALMRAYELDTDLSQRLAEVERLHAEAERAREEREASQYLGRERFRPQPFDRAAIHRFMQAGDERNMLRHAQRDGLRIMAFLAQFCEPDEDPVKVVVRVMHAAGYDVDPADMAWADPDFDSEYDEEDEEYEDEEGEDDGEE